METEATREMMAEAAPASEAAPGLEAAPVMADTAAAVSEVAPGSEAALASEAAEAAGTSEAEGLTREAEGTAEAVWSPAAESASAGVPESDSTAEAREEGSVASGEGAPVREEDAERAAVAVDIAQEHLAKEKRAILREAREALRANEYDPAAVNEILRRFDEAGDAGEMAEAELARQREEIVQRMEAKEERIAERARNAEKKRGLVEQARALADSEEWKDTSARFKALMDEWRRAGNAGEENDQLWDAFNESRTRFFDRQRAHYDELDARNAGRREEKEKLIAMAREAAEGSTDWKQTHERLEEIFAAWKAVGTAGREDERLWKEFQDVRNEFYERRTAARNEQQQIFKIRKEDKEALIAQAERYVSIRDYSPKTMERMREMGGDWKDIGFCGRKLENELWERFHAAQDAYWKGRRAASEAHHQEWVEKTQGAIGRREDRVERLKTNIENLRERIATATEEKKVQIEGWIAENEEQIRSLTAEIERMKAEIQD